MDASAAQLRDQYLAALAAGEKSGEKLWQLFVNNPWYQQQLKSATARAVHVVRLPADSQGDVQDEAMVLFEEKLERDPNLHLNPALVQTKFPGWLGRIIYRDCLEAARTWKSQNPPHFEIRPSDRMTYDMIQQVEVDLDIELAVRRLPPDQRQIIGLYFEGYRVDEIALLRQEPYTKTHRHYAAALEELARLLG